MGRMQQAGSYDAHLAAELALAQGDLVASRAAQVIHLLSHAHTPAHPPTRTHVRKHEVSPRLRLECRKPLKKAAEAAVEQTLCH